MPSSFFVPVVALRRLPPLFCLSFGALCAMLLTLFVLSQRYHDKNEQLFDDFGAALAHLTAQELIDAAASRDLIRLQALLQSVAAQPRVAMAVVYDANNELLVQAGEVVDPDQVAQYRAEIAVPNNVVGHVDITVDTRFTGDSTLRWTVTAIAAVLLLASALALFECFGDVWHLEARPWPKRAKPAPQEEPVMSEPAIADAALLEEEQVPATDFDYSDLIVHISNRKRLREQLSGELYGAAIKRFERVLNRVLALYGGVRVASQSSEDYYCVRFMSRDGVAEAAFSAACAAHLLTNLSQQQKVKLDCLAQVCTHDCDVKLALGDTGIYLQQSVLDSGLQGRMVLSEAGGRTKVEGFNHATEALLARQQAQLSQALA